MSSSDSESDSSSSSSRASSPASASSSAASTPPPAKTLKRKRRVEQAPLEELVGEDEQALSHAEKRRQKRKLARTGADDVLSTNAADKSAKSTKPSKAAKKDDVAPALEGATRRQNSIWVGNLSFKTTPDGLRKFFDGCGEITRVNMPMKSTSGDAGAKWKGALLPGRENKGFAYVDFATPDAKVVAITLSEGHLDGRKLLIKDGNDFNGRPAPPPGEGAAEESTKTKFARKVLAAQKQPECATLFMGNLSFETTIDSIKEMLSAHRRKPSKAAAHSADGSNTADSNNNTTAGTTTVKPDTTWIRKVRLGTFEDSGLCKGWAFVDFATTEDATAALTNPRNFRLDGRDIKLEYASPDAVRRGGGPGARPERRKSAQGGTTPGRPDAGVKSALREQAVAEREEEQEQADEPAAKADAPPPRKRTKREDGGAPPMRKGRDGRPRATPGAALALAKRESVAIVPSAGKKIKF